MLHFLSVSVLDSLRKGGVASVIISLREGGVASVSLTFSEGGVASVPISLHEGGVAFVHQTEGGVASCALVVVKEVWPQCLSLLINKC